MSSPESFSNEPIVPEGEIKSSPESQFEEIKSPRDQIIESGIAQRMLDSIINNKRENAPEITFGIDDCDFRVKKDEAERGEEEHIQVTIEMPNLDPETQEKKPTIQYAFGVTEDGCFGVGGEEPLTAEQFQIVNELANQRQ